VGALVSPDVGDYLNRHFVSAFQKVASFRIVGGAKQGGNVASYFCTPEGRVLHAIAGPVAADVFLREARWAHETLQMANLAKTPEADLRAFFRKAHVDRLRQEHGLRLPLERLAPPDDVRSEVLGALLDQNLHLQLNNQGKTHLVLAVAAMPRLEQVYQVVFERILNQKISTQPVQVRN